MIFLGAALAFAGAISYALANVFVRIGLRDDDSDNGVLASMLITVGVMTPLLGLTWFTGNTPTLRWVGLAWFAAAGLLTTFLGRVFLFASIRHAGVARAGAIIQTQPVYTLALAVTFLSERFERMALFGVVIALVGLALFIAHSLSADAGPPSLDVATSESVPTTAQQRGSSPFTSPIGRRTTGWGVLLATLAAASFGAGHVVRRQGLDYIPNSIVGVTLGTWVGLCAYLAWDRLSTGRIISARPELRSAFRWYFIFAGSAVAVAQLVTFSALLYAPASYVAVILALQGILSVLFSAMLLQRLEWVTASVVAAAALIFAGSAMIALSG